MVVRGEEADTADMRGDMMEDRLRDGHTIVGACTAAEFVEDDKGAGGSFGKDLFSFGELDEEGGLGGEDVVVGAEAGHDTVAGGEAGGDGGDVAANLGHDDGDAGLERDVSGRRVRCEKGVRDLPCGGWSTSRLHLLL